jgi:hypothetical protein
MLRKDLNWTLAIELQKHAGRRRHDHRSDLLSPQRRKATYNHVR